MTIEKPEIEKGAEAPQASAAVETAPVVVEDSGTEVSEQRDEILSRLQEMTPAERGGAKGEEVNAYTPEQQKFFQEKLRNFLPVGGSSSSGNFQNDLEDALHAKGIEDSRTEKKFLAGAAVASVGTLGTGALIAVGTGSVIGGVSLAAAIVPVAGIVWGIVKGKHMIGNAMLRAKAKKLSA